MAHYFCSVDFSAEILPGLQSIALPENGGDFQ
jgi:hypothetical protein